MFGGATIFQVKIWTHPTETTMNIYLHNILFWLPKTHQKTYGLPAKLIGSNLHNSKFPALSDLHLWLYHAIPDYACVLPCYPVLAEHAHPATRHQFSRTGLQSGCSSLPSGRVFGNPHMKTVQDWLCVTGPHIAWFASKAPRPCPRRRIPFQGVSQECESGHSWCILPRMPSKTAVGQASWRFQLHCMEWPLQEAYGFCQWLLALSGSDGICSRTHGAKHAKLMLFCVH